MNEVKYWTGVGSRELPQEVLDLMHRIGQVLAEKGYTLRSGAAGGADSAFQRGVCSVNPKLTQIWWPWDNFSRPSKCEGSVYIVPTEEQYNVAQAEYTKKRPTHPRGVLSWFPKMNYDARKFHARNYYQVNGQEGEDLSCVCIYGAPEEKGKVRGGTRSAVELSRAYGIPTYNLLIPEQRKILCEKLNIKIDERGKIID